MIDILAALSASAAGGMRVALPLLVVGLIQSGLLWSRVPLLATFHPQVIVAILVSWSLFEILASKSLLGQRFQQVLQLYCSPIAGAILGLTVAINRGLAPWLTGLIGGIGGMLALVIYLVQAGWFYRLKGIPVWVAIVEDILCVCLVFLAFGAPREGGLLALLLLWLAIRSSSEWNAWYRSQNKSSPYNPRQGKSKPD